MKYEDAINSNHVVLVEFYASWCPHCHRMAPVVAQIKEILAGQADVYQIEIDENQALAEQEGVQSIPTFIVYRDGQEMWRDSGEMEAEYLLSHIEKYF